MRRRRPLPVNERGPRESERRFAERMRRQRQIENAEVTEEVDEDGRVWVVRHLPPPDRRSDDGGIM